MCKKLMFLISLVLLLGVAAGAYAEDIEVGCGETYIVSGTESVGDMWVEGTLIVPVGAVLNLSDESTINGCAECAAEADMGQVIVEGELNITDRFNLNYNRDALLIVRNGGVFVQTDNSDGIKLPDNEGGCHIMRIAGAGSRISAVRIEVRPDRDAQIDLCDGAVLELDTVKESYCYRSDPLCWIPDGVMTHCEGVGDPLDVVYGIPTSDGVTVTAPAACDPDKATKPKPDDGATGVKCVNTDVVLEWQASCPIALCGPCRNIVYFAESDPVTGCQAVEDAEEMQPPPWIPPPEYQGYTLGGSPAGEWNLGNLPLWKNYCWRVDQGPMGPIVKGDIWTFTSGCPLINGDLNLDCLLNAEDYSILLETWKEEQYFPW